MAVNPFLPMIDGWINYIEDSSALDLQSWSAQPSKYASIELFMYIPIYIYIYMYIVLLLGRLTDLKKNTLGWQWDVMALQLHYSRPTLTQFPHLRLIMKTLSISI